jgi:hypothetical protein
MRGEIISRITCSFCLSPMMRVRKDHPRGTNREMVDEVLGRLS